MPTSSKCHRHCGDSLAEHRHNCQAVFTAWTLKLKPRPPLPVTTQPPLSKVISLLEPREYTKHIVYIVKLHFRIILEWSSSFCVTGLWTRPLYSWVFLYIDYYGSPRTIYISAIWRYLKRRLFMLKANPFGSNWVPGRHSDSHGRHKNVLPCFRGKYGWWNQNCTNENNEKKHWGKRNTQKKKTLRRSFSKVQLLNAHANISR